MGPDTPDDRTLGDILSSALARADASPAPPARGRAFGTHEMASQNEIDQRAARRRARASDDWWCEQCDRFHPAGYVCAPDEHVPPAFDTELRALAVTATDRHPGAGSGDQRAVDRYRRPDGRAGDKREFNGPEQPRMGGTPGLPDAGAPRMGEPQPSAQQQIVRLRELVDAALVQVGQAHSAELAAAHDRVLAAEREITEQDGHVAKLLAELADAARREAGLREKIDGMIGCAGRIAEIAKAPPKAAE